MAIKEKKFIFMVPDLYTLRTTNTSGLCLIMGLQEIQLDDITIYEPVFKLSVIKYANKAILDKYVFIRSKSLFTFNDFFRKTLYPKMLKPMTEQSELLQPQNKFLEYSHRLSNKYEVTFSVINTTRYNNYTIFDIEIKFVNIQNPKLSFYVNMPHDEVLMFFKYLIQVENNIILLQQPSININDTIIVKNVENNSECNNQSVYNSEEELIRRSFEIQEQKKKVIKDVINSQLKRK